MIRFAPLLIAGKIVTSHFIQIRASLDAEEKTLLAELDRCLHDYLSQAYKLNFENLESTRARALLQWHENTGTEDPVAALHMYLRLKAALSRPSPPGSSMDSVANFRSEVQKVVAPRIARILDLHQDMVLAKGEQPRDASGWMEAVEGILESAQESGLLVTSVGAEKPRREFERKAVKGILKSTQESGLLGIAAGTEKPRKEFERKVRVNQGQQEQSELKIKLEDQLQYQTASVEHLSVAAQLLRECALEQEEPDDELLGARRCAQQQPKELTEVEGSRKDVAGRLREKESPDKRISLGHKARHRVFLNKRDGDD